MSTAAEQLIKEGEEKGIEKGKLEDAKNMLKEGIDEDTVIKVTGLSSAKVQNIKKELD